MTIALLGLNPLDGTSPVRMPPSRVQAGLRRFGQAMLLVLAPLAAASGYRAWFQVWSLDLTVYDSPVRPGSMITVSALTSGRVHVDLRLELWQDGLADVLGADRARTRFYPEMDPRPRRGVMTVVVTKRWRGVGTRGPRHSEPRRSAGRNCCACRRQRSVSCPGQSTHR